MKWVALLVCSVWVAPLCAQEAGSGFDLRGVLSGEFSYSRQLASEGNAPLAGSYRLLLYPTWKLSSHWTLSLVVQSYLTPYFYEEFREPEHRVRSDLLQANLSYSRFWEHGSVAVRLGELPTAFGSFLLRYDDAVNPLIDVPLAYGYYYRPVTDLGLAGAQVDITQGRWDARAQFTNSSPANRRSLLDRDQYGDWAGGLGLTIRQGFRVGASAYRGPYLDRQYEFYFAGEAEPKALPATAVGFDVQWGGGPWNVYGEWQHFQMDYRAIPTFRERIGYAEARRVLTPRWYVATRVGYSTSNLSPGRQAYELVAGFRPNCHQVAKAGYEIVQGPDLRGTLANVLTFQLVTSFRAFSVAGK